LTGYEYRYGESPTFSIEYGDAFSIEYGDGYRDVHIIVIIPVISLSPFKFLKYSQLIK